MLLKTWRFVTLLLAALALTMTSAHVLELPQKMRYDAATYAAVNGTLYRYFAIVGGAYEVGAIVAAALLAVLVRHRRSFRWTLAGAALLALAFASWLALVAPVNSEAAEALRAAPETVPTVWLRLRARWEYGHAAGFVLHLAGFCALVISVLSETPDASMPGAARP